MLIVKEIDSIKSINFILQKKPSQIVKAFFVDNFSIFTAANTMFVDGVLSVFIIC